MCLSHHVFDLAIAYGVFALFGWMWWVMFNAD